MSKAETSHNSLIAVLFSRWSPLSNDFKFQLYADDSQNVSMSTSSLAILSESVPLLSLYIPFPCLTFHQSVYFLTPGGHFQLRMFPNAVLPTQWLLYYLSSHLFVYCASPHLECKACEGRDLDLFPAGVSFLLLPCSPYLTELTEGDRRCRKEKQ
jgi:hypothetical protein